MPDLSALIQIRSVLFPQVCSVTRMPSRPVFRLLPVSMRFHSTAFSTGHFRLKLMIENLFALLGSEGSRFVSGLAAPAVRLVPPRPAELFWSKLTVWTPGPAPHRPPTSPHLKRRAPLKW